MAIDSRLCIAGEKAKDNESHQCSSGEWEVRSRPGCAHSPLATSHCSTDGYRFAATFGDDNTRKPGRGCSRIERESSRNPSVLGSRVVASTRTAVIRENPRTIREDPRPGFLLLRGSQSQKYYLERKLIARGTLGSRFARDLTTPKGGDHLLGLGGVLPVDHRCLEDR